MATSTIHPMSSTTMLPEFDIFGISPTQTSIERNIITEHRPIVPPEKESNSFILLDYIIHTAEDEYLRLNDLELYFKIKFDIKKFDQNGKDVEITLADWNSVSPVNNLLHSMIKEINVFIGANQINASSSTYAYKAFLKKRVAFSQDAKSTTLTSALYYKDDYDNMDKILKDAILLRTKKATPIQKNLVLEAPWNFMISFILMQHCKADFYLEDLGSVFK